MMLNKMNFVDGVFSKVANKYTLMNDAMSFGFHRIWKKNFINTISIKNNDNYLDLSCGDGDIASLIYKKYPFVNITLCDPIFEMLQKAQKRIKNAKIITSHAEEMPFENYEFDVITCSFGMRNFTDIDKSLIEMKRILKDDGKIYILEFFPDVSNKFMFDKIYNFYLKNCIPFLGKIITGSSDEYEYFSKSIINFHSKDEIYNKIKQNGFEYCNIIDLFAGVLSIICISK